jgi:Flp pilus assembly pilin Flp
MTGRRGASATEYMLLISVILVALVAAAYVFVPIFGEGVEAVAQDVEALLSGEGNDAVASRDDAASSDCPYTFDPRTGRYHDASDGGYLMVSFSDAEQAGCGQ